MLKSTIYNYVLQNDFQVSKINVTDVTATKKKCFDRPSHQSEQWYSKRATLQVPAFSSRPNQQNMVSGP